MSYIFPLWDGYAVSTTATNLFTDIPFTHSSILHICQILLSH